MELNQQSIPYILVINCQIKLKFVTFGWFKMLSRNPEPKLKYSKNRIFVTSHFGTLFAAFYFVQEKPESAYLCL